LLNRLTDRFPKILVIADNVHRRGSDAFFVTFNYFARQDKSEKIIKFLFGAREEEFKTAKEGLEREKAAEIDVALRRIHQVRIDFSFEDAILFLKKANAISDQKEMSEQEIKIMSDIGYKATGGDPFMFILGLMAYVSGKDTAPRMDFLSRDLNEKIGSLAEDERLLKAGG
jgi:hypothetical protein